MVCFEKYSCHLAFNVNDKPNEMHHLMGYENNKYGVNLLLIQVHT